MAAGKLCHTIGVNRSMLRSVNRAIVLNARWHGQWTVWHRPRSYRDITSNTARLIHMIEFRPRSSRNIISNTGRSIHLIELRPRSSRYIISYTARWIHRIELRPRSWNITSNTDGYTGLQRMWAMQLNHRRNTKTHVPRGKLFMPNMLFNDEQFIFVKNAKGGCLHDIFTVPGVFLPKRSPAIVLPVYF